jgi:hypothetical protein
MQVKIVRLFLLSSGILLLFTSISKIISGLGSDRVLETQDPLFLISYRSLFLIFGIFELGVALWSLIAKYTVFRIGLIAWLATCFAIYRISMPWIGYLKPCPCLGSLTSAIHISPKIADDVMKVVLAYLLIGSYTILFWFWWQWKKYKRKNAE